MLGGAANDRNTFSEHFGAIFVGGLSNESSLLVSHNRGDVQQGVVVWEFTISPSDPTDIEISHNELNLADLPPNPTLGIWLEDDSLILLGNQGIRALIEDNAFGQTDFGYGSNPWAGILHVGGIDTIIQNNRISGDFSIAGIAAGYIGPRAVAQNLAIIGNNLAGTTAAVAPIWLGPFSSDSIVVGGHNRVDVLDQGVDNIITGVNNMHGNPPGPEVQEAIDQMLNFMMLPVSP